MSVVYRSIAHGRFTTGETLNYAERSNILVLSVGLEGMPAYLTPTTVVLDFLCSTYGSAFVDALCDVLDVYGNKYLDFKDPHEAGVYGEAILYLFRVNRQDLKRLPQQRFRLYGVRDKMQNLDLGKLSDHECIEIDATVPKMSKMGFRAHAVHKVTLTRGGRLVDKPYTHQVHLRLFLSPRAAVLSEEKRRTVIVREILPFGTYRLPPGGGFEKVPEREVPTIPTAPQFVRLDAYLRSIRRRHPTAKRLIVVANYCRGYAGQMMQVQDPHLHPMQETTQGLLDLFQRLRLTQK